MKSYPPAALDFIAEETRAELPQEAPGAEPRVGPLRVLIVEDNVDSAEALRELLRLWGHEAQLAHDGPAGLALAVDFAPDVVLLDIGLPGMDGYQVAEELRRREGVTRTLLVALTGFGRLEDRERARQAGIDHHFTKPVDLGALRDLLARA